MRTNQQKTITESDENLGNGITVLMVSLENKSQFQYLEAIKRMVVTMEQYSRIFMAAIHCFSKGIC